MRVWMVVGVLFLVGCGPSPTSEAPKATSQAVKTKPPVQMSCTCHAIGVSAYDCGIYSQPTCADLQWLYDHERARFHVTLVCTSDDCTLY
jgi:hypothetical protein